SVEASAQELQDNLFPDKANEDFIAGWERALGLLPPEGATLEERRTAVVTKLRERGGLSKEYFIALAAAMGYEIEIEDVRPMECGLAGVAEVGLPLWHPRAWTAWRVRVLNHGMDSQVYFRKLGFPPFAIGPGAPYVSDVSLLAGDSRYPRIT